MAALERLRSYGWFHFLLGYTAIAVMIFGIASVAMLGLLTNLSLWARLALILPSVLVMSLAAAQLTWWTIPDSLERLRESSKPRGYLYREGFFFFSTGLVSTLTVTVLPLMFGQDYAAADMMITIVGSVFTGWGLKKIYRYWSDTPDWRVRTFANRFVRTHLYALQFLLLILYSMVRAVTFYADASWAAPIQRLLK